MAGIKDFKKVSSGSPEISKLQERLQEFFAPIVANPLLDGRLLIDIELDTTVTQVEHKLGRAALGWIIVNKTADESVWQPNNNFSGSFLNLQASGPITVSLWAF